ncbi:hypothetical protein PghCCS26_62630 [Paenibacillus glycanilyticus]|uniref:M23ase beta-sheet core domain-containing protein n=1 Tax=Paenibacillus glycanilyticus TaxID=126569 RepID=A0ABQ6NX01_9BACL|nr:M23 family metallopeptidase [Paenibacillus glycanilyticus]GMK49133.1 hypothetical protein PghCCS26_62630 [Paenibacillus glycanilyticus]
MIVNIRPRISSRFGAVDSVHTGVDVAIPEGTELHAVADSVVSKIVSKIVSGSDLGNGVFLHTVDGHDVIYGHMSRVTGDHLHAGDVIGLSGNTGHSTGPHLHLGMLDSGCYVDPTPLVDASVGSASAEVHGWGWNPFGGIKEGLDSLNDSLRSISDFGHSVAHYLNPVTWWNGLEQAFSSGALDSPLMIGTIVGIILMMGGARWPKKWIAWGWAIFWLLRGMVFS